MKNKKNIIIGTLVVLVLSLMTCTGCDIQKKEASENNNLNDNNQETTNNSSNSEVDYRFTSMSTQDYNALAKDINQETGREDDGKIMWEGIASEYQSTVIQIRNDLMHKLDYFPSNLLKNGGKVTDLTDTEKAEYIWWYVYDNKIEGNKISKTDVDNIFKHNLNIKDYIIKSGTYAGGGHITENNGVYEIYLDGPDSSNKTIVNRIEYDKETKEIKAYFEAYMIGGTGAATGMKTSDGTAIFKVYYENNDFYFALDRIEKNK